MSPCRAGTEVGNELTATPLVRAITARDDLTRTGRPTESSLVDIHLERLLSRLSQKRYLNSDGRSRVGRVQDGGGTGSGTSAPGAGAAERAVLVEAATRARQVQERRSEGSWSRQSVGLGWLEAAARLSADNVKWQSKVAEGHLSSWWQKTE